MGTYTLTVTAKENSNFTGSATKNWEIQAAENEWITKPTVFGCTYGGEPTVNPGRPQFGAVTVEYFNQDGKTKLGTDIPTNAGDYQAVFTVAGTGNYNGLSMPLPFTITPAEAQFTPPTPKEGLTYTGQAQELIDPGSSNHGTFQYWLDGEQPGESIPQAKDAGTYTVHYQLMGDQNHKDGTAGKIDVEIAPKDITDATVTLGDSLTYNGQQQTQSIASVQVDGLDVMCDFTDRTGTNAGSYTMTLTGKGDFTGTKKVPWSIAKKDVTIQDVVVEASKVYDGTDNAAITDSGRLSDNFDGEGLTIHMGTAVYDNKNTGTDKTVTFTGFSLEGSAAGNYQLTGQPEATTASISPRPVTVSGITAQDKPFDGNTEATLNLREAVLEGVVAQDREKLGVTATGTFASANVGTDKTVNIGNLALTGEKAANYVLAESQQKQTTAAITPSDRYLDLTDIRQTLWMDGQPLEEMHDDGDYLYVPEGTGLITTYTMSADGSYPTGMKVYRVNRDSAKEQGVTLEEITAFDDLLLYGGCSIRLTGTKGIRMITGISETTRAGLTGTDGLEGYTLEEYGTVVMRGTGTPTLENSQSHNYAYKKGQADPIFGRTGGRIQFTNVLVGFSLNDCKDTLTLRPYIILKDTATGEALTLYGGCVSRSIGYIAKQNENTYQPGTAGYKYVHEIIDAVYGKTEQGGETK